MFAFGRLSEPIRQYIYEQGWQGLRPIQEAAIRVATETEDNFILSAPTAAGKTEAALLPALSLVSWSSPPDGVRILLISPLVALINDQTNRLWKLCKALSIPITAWHGEANTAAKRRCLANPSGIVLITPESLEAMFATHPERISALFSRLDWVLVDECHHFLSGARGVQLRSLLMRLERRSGAKPRYIGMSATLVEGNYEDAKRFFPSGRETRLVLDRTKRTIESTIQIFPVAWEKEKEENSAQFALYDALFSYLKKENLLIFPNSRRRVEEIAHALQECASREQVFLRVMAHHASMEKNLREEAEQWAKGGFSRFALCATSTLELGIDIGAVDAVCQIDAPFSAASLAQRLGRSGRGEVVEPQTGRHLPEPARVHLLTTEDEALLQAVTALVMVEEGTLEPVQPLSHPYDVFAHQVLSMALEGSELSYTDLYALSQWQVFSFLSNEDIEAIVEHLLAEDFLERSEGEGEEVFLGLAGERIATRRDFYAQFQTPLDFRVVAGKERIGMIPLTPQTMEGAHLLLAGRVWKIETIEEKARKIYVVPAKKGRAPLFSGNAYEVSALLRRRMLDVLYHPPESVLHNREAADAFLRLRGRWAPSSMIQWEESQAFEPVLTLFLGTRAERTLFLLLRALCETSNPALYWDGRRGRLYGEALKGALVRLRYAYREEGDALLNRIPAYLQADSAMLSRMLGEVKYAFLLPEAYRIRYVCENLCLSSLAPIMEEW